MSDSWSEPTTSVELPWHDPSTDSWDDYVIRPGKTTEVPYGVAKTDPEPIVLREVPAINRFNFTPVELVRMVAKAIDEPEGLAALSLTNLDIHSIVKDIVAPGYIAFTAIRNLDARALMLILRTLGGDEIKAGLLIKANIEYIKDLWGAIYASPNDDGPYAFENAFTAPITDVCDIISPFFTPGHATVLVAYKLALEHRRSSAMEHIATFLSEEQVKDAITFNAGLTNMSLFPAALTQRLIQRIPMEHCNLLTAEFELAIINSNVELLKLLLQVDVNPNFEMEHEDVQLLAYTPLHYVCVWGLHEHEEKRAVRQMVHLLCEYGADTNAKDFAGLYVLHHLAMNGYQTVEPTVQFEDNLTNDRTEAVYEDILRTVMSHGANPDVQDKDGVTPLHIAVEKGEEIMVKVLMEWNVDASLVNNWGDKPSGCNFNVIPSHLTPGIKLAVHDYERRQAEFKKMWVEAYN